MPGAGAVVKPEQLELVYEWVDVEIIPPNYWSLWPGWAKPFTTWADATTKSLGYGDAFKKGVRLESDSYHPAMVMVVTALFYYFILVPYIYPMFRSENSTVRSFYSFLRSSHNLFLCIYSGISCALVFVFMYERNQFNWDGLLCEPVKGTWLRPISILFCISKIYEWGDTFFLVVLGNRGPEFLHLYHHATTFWLFTLVTNNAGCEKMGLLLNGFVHTLMYSHYFRSWPKALVPFITLAQILQLAFVTYSWTIATYPVPGYCGPKHAMAPVFDNYFIEWLTPYSMVPVYLYFFVVFFVKRYILGSKGRPANKKAKKA